MRIEDCAEKHFHCFITMYLPSKICVNFQIFNYDPFKNFSEIPNTFNKQHEVNEFQN